MFLNVALANDEREALIIPEEALSPEAERQFVFVVVDGKVSRREVRIGGRRPGSVEIIAGLSAGERVVVEGTQKVREGSSVKGTDRTVDGTTYRQIGNHHEASAGGGSPASIAQ